MQSEDQRMGLDLPLGVYGWLLPPCRLETFSIHAKSKSNVQRWHAGLTTGERILLSSFYYEKSSLYFSFLSSFLIFISTTIFVFIFIILFFYFDEYSVLVFLFWSSKSRPASQYATSSRTADISIFQQLHACKWLSSESKSQYEIDLRASDFLSILWCT